ncbi:hypothetical protein CFP65_0631 [Kitasatospora sp. MMS16-BH015]|uniref:hypothetical protein n=1 Tax=Kitasatospora sp. MMS16-BH015 TaxID=2018025 RepID=UPI000CA27214|nr:hypothetical protein [Kitasatospora sp. MMS16-BH015]AUG75587.1 hypothetical protein CFP65_0631 [Kitasatospora sp. MMS16-BH015]
MNLVPVLGAVLAISIAVGALAISQRLRPALAPDEEAPAPHAALSTIGAGLLSGFVLLTGFLVATGWAAHTTKVVPPSGLYAADAAAGCAVLLYPALAGLPFTARHATAVACFGALVGYTLSMAVQLRP